MTRRPGSAVHVPPDCLSGITQEQALKAAGMLTWYGRDREMSAEWREAKDAAEAMLRRLAPYLPSDA